jgi:hypothetical protein
VRREMERMETVRIEGRREEGNSEKREGDTE